MKTKILLMTVLICAPKLCFAFADSWSCISQDRLTDGHMLTVDSFTPIAQSFFLKKIKGIEVPAEGLTLKLTDREGGLHFQTDISNNTIEVVVVKVQEDMARLTVFSNESLVESKAVCFREF